MRGALCIRLRGAVLPSVLTASVLLMMLTLGLLWLREADAVLFSRGLYRERCRADMESGFTLYRDRPSLADTLPADGRVYLYGPSSPAVGITVMRWGLYEAVTVEAGEGSVHSTRLLGARYGGPALYYSGNRSPLTLAGRTDIAGRADVPAAGVVYGQRHERFFTGRRLNPSDIGVSASSLPAVCPRSAAVAGELLGLAYECGDSGNAVPDSLYRQFYGCGTELLAVGDGFPQECFLGGNIVVTGGRVRIGPGCRLWDVIVAARSVTVADGFNGRVQIFADSVAVEGGARLLYPSGIYAARYACLEDGARVGGYVAAVPSGGGDAGGVSYRQMRRAVLYGLLYVGGTAELQGLVVGAAYIRSAVHTTPDGYYADMLFDASVVGSVEPGFPLLLDSSAEARRKEAAWLR